jgi:hypothetical protein
MYEVDVDTMILLALTASAFAWYMSFSISEGRKEIKTRDQEALERLQRAERLKRLYNK